MYQPVSAVEDIVSLKAFLKMIQAIVNLFRKEVDNSLLPCYDSFVKRDSEERRCAGR